MGFALARGFIKENFNIIVCDKRVSLADKYRAENIPFTDNSQKALQGAHFVILAVKPQDAKSLAESIKEYIEKEAVLVSIMGGIKMQNISNYFQSKKIVRIMPNLPTTKLKGMSVWTCSESLSSEEKETIKKLLSSVGKEIFTETEDMIDSATSVSGSGPAYFFLFLKSLIDSARKEGFSSEEAKLLALQTGLGAIELAYDNDLDELIQQVASKGGTTERALKVFAEEEFTAIVEKAVQAAKKRAQEMSEKF